MAVYRPSTAQWFVLGPTGGRLLGTFGALNLYDIPVPGYAATVLTVTFFGALNCFGLGVIEGLTKVLYPEASNTVIFVIMVIVLIVRPAGLFGRER